MELRVSARKLLSSAYGSDPDDKEIGDDDDNDRNHKHRKREDARSQSLEDDVTEQVFTKPYRRKSKPFADGYFYGEIGSLSNETWKKYRFNPLEKEISAKFDQKRIGFTQYSRGPSDMNQSTRIYQPFSSDLGAVRDRGRDFSLWSQRDSKFISVDISSQIIKHGSVPRRLFAGKGLPTVSNSHGSSRSPFGIFPGIPNGGLDMLHPVEFQGTFRSAVTPSLSTGVARQRCRDFEEQGFCLRGEMCPMEHGVNRIVVEDVQSLSQFNLPVSLSTANQYIAPVGTGPSTSTSAMKNTLSNKRTSLGRNLKRGMGDYGLDVNDTFIDSAAAAAEFYDPDQPLWDNDSHTSNGPQSTGQPNVGKNDSLLDHGLFGDHRVGLSDDSDNLLGRYLNTRSARGKITKKKRSEMREYVIFKASTSNFMHNKAMKSLVPSHSTQDPPHQKMNNPNERMLRKPSQKAQRTLFVKAIPLQNNKRQTILSHFKKFGEVIDIFIPYNSERAFVQFSKREEAEAALMASDAVMGNRFIKLRWANRDTIRDNKAFSHRNMSVASRGLTVSTVSPYISVAKKRKDDSQLVLHNGFTTPNMSTSAYPKHVVANGPKVPPPLQKKLDSLEVLKEELRKKQEMLDQKRNDFRRKLDILTKQVTGLKGEVAPEPAAKKQKVEILADSILAATWSSRDPDTILPSSQDEVEATSSKSVDPSEAQNAKTTLALARQESSSFRSSPRPLVHVGSPLVSKRFKLDNRPTTFKIVPPLPDGLVDVFVLKEHFSLYGDLLKVQLDDVAGNAETKTSTVSARVYFTTRHAAEKAFLSGQLWKGHNLQFVWLINSSKSRKDLVNKETLSPSSKANSSKTTSQKPPSSGDGESEKPKGNNIVEDHTQPDEIHHPNGLSDE